MDLTDYLEEQINELARLEAELEAAKTMLTLRGPILHSKGEKLYIVEEVRGRIKRNGRYYYKIKWLGFDELTWEPTVNLPNKVVEQYDATFPRPKRRRSKLKNSGFNKA